MNWHKPGNDMNVSSIEIAVQVSAMANNSFSLSIHNSKYLTNRKAIVALLEQFQFLKYHHLAFLWFSIWNVTKSIAEALIMCLTVCASLWSYLNDCFLFSIWQILQIYLYKQLVFFSVPFLFPVFLWQYVCSLLFIFITLMFSA